LSPPPDRPNPEVYTQSVIIASGQLPTWNSPDVSVRYEPTVVGGKWQIPREYLLPNPSISVHNTSTSAAAVNTLVAVSAASWGIGLPKIPLGTYLVSIAPGQSATLSLPSLFVAWGDLKGVLYVDLSHPYDADIRNNHGQDASLVFLTDDPTGAGYAFQVGNQEDAVREVALTIAPNALSASLSQTSFTLSAGASQSVLLSCGSMPPRPRPFEEDVTVIATDTVTGALIGGVTHRFFVS
jgi:hypothetical protein